MPPLATYRWFPKSRSFWRFCDKHRLQIGAFRKLREGWIVHACTRKLPQQSIFDHSLHLRMLHFTHIRCFLKKERLVIPFLNVKSWIRKKLKIKILTKKDSAPIGPPQPLPPQPMIPLPLSIEHSSFWMIPRPLSIEHRAFWTMHQTFSV